MMAKILKYHDKRQLTQAAADLFINLAAASIKKRGIFSAALSGGSTPQPLYRLLGEPQVKNHLDWNDIYLFFVDERHVPPKDPESNYRMVKESLFNHVDIPQENVHRVPAEMEPRMAAFSYEEELRADFSD
jgi:6-phosphogluconolactonase